MKTILSLLFICFNTQASLVSDKSDLKEFRKFEHENLGCPINSVCSKENGAKILAWEKMLSMSDTKSLHKQINKFKKKHGIPIEFLSKNKKIQGFDSIYFKSRCKQHNPTNPNNSVQRAISFLKNDPQNEDIILDTVIVHANSKKIIYKIPYQDIPVLIKNKSLVMTKDYDDDFYQLAVTTQGNFNIIDIPVQDLRKAMNRRIKEVKCPSQMEINTDYHTSSYCQKIWNDDTKKLDIIELSWSCP